LCFSTCVYAAPASVSRDSSSQGAVSATPKSIFSEIGKPVIRLPTNGQEPSSLRRAGLGCRAESARLLTADGSI
jgi:hypothetical protein